jgi:predicted N-acetyltransferase YhbS
MGRVIGDGGTFFQVVDIAVAPEHQGRGLGKAIMAEIAGFIAREVPESGYVSLLADGNACRLYQQFGFSLTAPASVGMALKQAAGGAQLPRAHETALARWISPALASALASGGGLVMGALSGRGCGRC